MKLSDDGTGSKELRSDDRSFRRSTNSAVDESLENKQNLLITNLRTKPNLSNAKILAFQLVENGHMILNSHLKCHNSIRCSYLL